MEKKLFLRQTAASKQKGDVLTGTVQRDHESLVLPLTVIKLSKNIRTDVDEEKIRQLAASIEQNGLINPLTIRKTDGGTFELVAGARRYLALKHLGRTEAAVKIKNITEDQAVILKLAENLDRAELTGWEVCQAIHNLLPMCGGSQTRVAELVKRNRSYVSRCISVIEAHPDVSRVKQLPLRELFKHYGTTTKVAPEEERSKSGPVAGGRYGAAGCLTFNERKDGKAFSLRLNVDFDRTPPASRQEIVKILERLLTKLRG